jgi:hypothetical protein
MSEIGQIHELHVLNWSDHQIGVNLSKLYQKLGLDNLLGSQKSAKPKDLTVCQVHAYNIVSVSSVRYWLTDSDDAR